MNISENVIGGDNLYLGAGAKILTGVSLANGIIVGANAVVTKSFTEDNIVVAGCPAKEVSKRGMFSDRDVI